MISIIQYLNESWGHIPRSLYIHKLVSTGRAIVPQIGRKLENIGARVENLDPTSRDIRKVGRKIALVGGKLSGAYKNSQYIPTNYSK